MYKKHFIIVKKKANPLLGVPKNILAKILDLAGIRARFSLTKTNKTMRTLLETIQLDIYSNILHVDVLAPILSSSLPLIGLNLLLTDLDSIRSHIPQLQKLALTSKCCLNVDSLFRAKRLSHLNLIAEISGLDSLFYCQNLRHVSIKDCSTKISLTPLNNCSELRTLSFQNCNIDLSDLKDLFLLRKITLSSCNNIIALPCFSGCINLEEIEISQCNKLITLGESSLTSISISLCPSFLSIEGLRGNTSLISFISIDNGSFSDITPLQECFNLTHLDLIGSTAEVNILPLLNCTKLKHLSFNGSKITLVELITKFTNLEHLNLSDACNIEELPLLPKLKELSYKNALSKITFYPELEELYLAECHKLTDLSILAKCSKLVKVSLISCNKLDKFDFDNKLTSLTILNSDISNIRGSSTLLKLNLSNTKLSNFLTLANCINLEDLRCTAGTCLMSIEGIQNLVKLTRLSLDSCDILTSIAPILRCTNLISLSLRRCYLLRSINPVSSLPNLRQLYLDRCINLEDIDHIGECAKLVTLILSGCNKIANLDNLKYCSLLQNLNISCCNEIKYVAPLVKCINLENLIMQSCTGITYIYPLSFCLRLRKLDFAYSFKVSDFTDFMRNPPLTLKEVRIRNGQYMFL